MVSQKHETAAECVEVRALTGGEFDKIAALAYEKFGLELKKGKEDLVSARLGKQIRAGSFRSFSDYYDHLVGDRTGESLISMIDALTTNHTSFYREKAHFDFLTGEVLPLWKSKAQIRIWSAACSSGEEPYTILMTLGEALGQSGLERVEVFATDISTRVLEMAQRAVYPDERFRDVPRSLLSRYLLRGEGKAAGHYRVKPSLVSRVQFQRMNLIERFPTLPLFDVIFCRNVMIYFDRETQQTLVNRLAGYLEPGGYLFIGHAESLTGIEHGLEYIRPAIYRRKSTR
ncbi:MAG: protein-glutamate O-methyltransferase [Bryobacteraceae bacterium]